MTAPTAPRARTADEPISGLPEKRRAILEAATRVFLDQGYGNASMDAIAQAAGVSKQTVYSHFGAKDALFAAIVRAKCDDVMAPLARIDTGGGAPADVLTALARGFLEAILIEDNMTLYRIIVGECARFPELAAAFYAVGPRLAADSLAEYLARMDKAERLRVAEPRVAAELFFAMLRADLYMKRVLGVADAPRPGVIEAHAEVAVSAFLARFGPA